MASTSPSEFLTFFRRLTVSNTVPRAATSHANPIRRTFISSAPLRTSNKQDDGNIISSQNTQQDSGPGDAVGGSREHATSKAQKKDPNVQSYEVHAGQKARATDTGGHAARGVDERNSTAKAKKEHPEAPDVVIGMQDERGSKGL